jgi:hypothetical protein
MKKAIKIIHPFGNKKIFKFNNRIKLLFITKKEKKLRNRMTAGRSSNRNSAQFPPLLREAIAEKSEGKNFLLCDSKWRQGM